MPNFLGVFVAFLCADPWYARTIPSEPRVLVVHGSSLSSANSTQDPSLTVGLADWQYHPDVRAERNWSVSRVLQFFAPDIQPGEYDATLTVGGQSSYFVASVGPRAALVDRSHAMDVVELSEPLTIRGDVDYQGATIRASKNFRGRWLIDLRGSIRNARIEAQGESKAANPQWCVRVDADNVQMHHVHIVHESPGGAGVYLIRCRDSTFANVRVRADYCIDAQPNGDHARNTFYRCVGAPSRPGSGQMGRAFLGRENIVYECSWNGLDRGPVAQSAGPPMHRTLLYRCSQRYTGTTINGSEGILWEAIHGRPVQAHVSGKTATCRVESPSHIDARKGVFFWNMTSREVAVIESVKTAPGVVTLSLDRVLRQGPCIACVGNGAVENTIANCSATNGARYIWFFSRAADNAILGGDVRDVYDVVSTTEIDRTQPNDAIAFSWRLLLDRVRVSPSCMRPRVVWTGYDARRPPQENLPWYREAR